MIVRARSPNLVGRTDKTTDRDHAAVHIKLSNFRNAPDILLPVLQAEAQIGIDAAANIVTIQQLRKMPLFE